MPLKTKIVKFCLIILSLFSFVWKVSLEYIQREYERVSREKKDLENQISELTDQLITTKAAINSLTNQFKEKFEQLIAEKVLRKSNRITINWMILF